MMGTWQSREDTGKGGEQIVESVTGTEDEAPVETVQGGGDVWGGKNRRSYRGLSAVWESRMKRSVRSARLGL